MPARSTPGGPFLNLENPAFVQVDKDGVPITPGAVNISGLSVSTVSSTTATTTSIASSTTSQSILVANTNRQGAKLLNLSTAIFYGRYGTATASSSNCSFVLGPMISNVPEAEEVPFGYKGAITGVWSAANGTLSVTEFT